MHTLEDLKQAFDILEELEKTTSRNEKMAILKQGKDNPALKELLRLALDPYCTFGIRDYDEVQPEGEGISPMRNAVFINHLHSLALRGLTGNEAKETIASFFKTLSPLELKWYDRVLKKDLRVGVTAKTVNKVFPKLIELFECMLAKPLRDVKRLLFPVIVEPKLDGYRALAFVENGDVTLYTRNGNLIEGFEEIRKELSRLPSGYVYDGEIIGLEHSFKDMQKTVFRKGGEKKGVLYLFDMLPIEEFKRGYSTENLLYRKVNLEKALQGGFQTLRLVPYHGPIEEEREGEIHALFERYVQEGYEGIMVKGAHSLYRCMRSSDWVKLKPSDTYDLPVVGYVEGTGKYEGMLGALIVDFDGNPVHVGSGFTDEERRTLWANREGLIGRIVEVQADCVTENQEGGKSLRFPVFKQFRPDKE